MGVNLASDDLRPQHSDSDSETIAGAPDSIGHLPFSLAIDYHAQWRAFALRYYTALVLLISWPVAVAGLFCWSRFYAHQPMLSLLLMVLWLAAALTAVWWAGEFRCPRCRRRYGALGSKKGSTNLTRGFFDQVCNNCKLRKFEHAS